MYVWYECMYVVCTILVYMWYEYVVNLRTLVRARKISLKNLELWDKFEKLNPNSFREMYQFWSRKSTK